MNKFGARLWRLGVATDPLHPTRGEDEEDVYIWADNIEVSSSGALIAWGGFRDGAKFAPPEEKIIVCSFAPGQWFYFFAASWMDGSAVCRDKDD